MNTEALNLPQQFISVAISVYKAEGCLEKLYSRLSASLRSLTERYEIILVEDCGGDNSWSIIQALSKRDQRVKGTRFSRNFGQHSVSLQARIAAIARLTGLLLWIATCKTDRKKFKISCVKCRRVMRLSARAG